jgi:hypothetical protein
MDKRLDKRRTASLAAAVISASVSFPVAAHHSYMNAPFDPCQSKSIEGQIQQVTWNAPHVWLTVKADDSTVYQVEWTGPANLANEGVEAADLPVGGRIFVTGSPHLSSNAISLLQEVRVSGSELNWSRSFSMASGRCPAPQQ